jgi:hypothetical protein
MAFLITNTTMAKKTLFNASEQKDYWDYSPVVAGPFEKTVNVKCFIIRQGAQGVLASANVDLERLKHINYSGG